jgi:PAS domain S-box-containing protein
MSIKRRFALLALIMITVVFIITGITVLLVYITTLNNIKFDLTESLRNQVSIVRTIYKNEKDKNLILLFLHNSKEKYEGIGKSGEFTMAVKRNDSIFYLISHRNELFSQLKPVPFGKNIAIPMKMALLGQTGTIIGKDYRGKEVIAAYTFINELGWGAVEKIDLEEIQKPFIDTIFISIGISIFLVLIGSLLFVRITKPILLKITDTEEKYHLLVQGQAELVTKVDKEGNLRFISSSYCEKIGIPEKELLGTNYLALVHPDDIAMTLKAQESLLQWPHTSYTEIRAKIRNGWEWIAWSTRAIVDTRGNIEEIIGVGRDITKQKESEIAMRESEELFRRIFEESPLGMATTATDFHFTKTNAAFRKMIGYSEEELSVLSFKEITHPDHITADIAAIQKLSKGEIQLYQTEKRYIRKDDRIVWGAATIAAIFDENKRFLYYLVMIENITKRKYAEIELMKSEKQLNLIADSIPAFVAHIDIDLNCLYVNQHYADWLKKPKEEIIGNKILDLLNSNYYKNHIQEIQKVLKGEYVQHEFIDMDQNGTDCYYNVYLVPQLEENKVVAFFVLIYDITKLKKAELKLMQQQVEVQQKNEEYQSLNESLQEYVEKIQKINTELLYAKERAEESDRLKMVFLSNISHEIRTPMNAIMGFSELLEKSDISSEKQEKFTQIIRRRSKDLLTIINDILDISKIDAGQFNIFESSGNINEMLNELFQYYEARNKINDKKDINFYITNILNSKEQFINADFGRLKQVIMNLIDNALKFTEIGSIEFGCNFKNTSELVFYVKDTGIGIPKNKQTIIFERFRQVEESHKRRFGGTGLGLPICKGIVELMGGSIWLESEMDKGSTFYFSIPYKPVYKISPIEESLVEKNFNWNDKCILVVEDDELSAAFFKEILQKTKVKYLSAENGKKAIDLFKSNSNINLVLMDIRLPDVDGFEITKKFKLQKPEIIIIAQTAYASEDDRIQCLEAGCDDYISKPVNRDLLFQLIQKHFDTLNQK